MKFRHMLSQRHRKDEPVRKPHTDDLTRTAYSFRRSRTLTGSASNAVTAAGHTDNHDLKSTRLKEHDLKKHRRKLCVLLVATLLVVGGLVWFVGQTAFRTRVRVGMSTAATADDLAAYKKSIDAYLSAHPSQRFLPTLNQAALSANLSTIHPEISAVHVTPGAVYEPTQFSLVARQPLAAWNLGARRYFIDDQGVAFEKNLFAAPAITVEDRSGIKTDQNTVVASTRLLHYIGRLIANTSSRGLRVSKIVLPPNMIKEVDIELVGKGYAIKTQSDRDPAGQAADIAAAVKYFDQKGAKPRYVDVRVSSKAFWQ